MEAKGLDDHRKAGKITADAREYAKKLVKIDAKLLEVAEKVEEFIEKAGGLPAFPVQISLNEIAAHYCSTPDDISVFKENDLVKIDVGVHVDGYVADTACSVDLSKDNRHQNLIKASEEALANAIKIVKAGVAIGDIGKVIHESIYKYGFSPIKNLSGHSVGYYEIHGAPSIPNFNTGEDTPLQENIVIAIEPFATNGAGVVYERDNANVFMLTGKKAVRNQITRDVLKEVERFKGLPFTERWLTKKGISLPKVNFALKEMDNLGILHKFPPLPDRNKGLVSQAEHTLIVKKDGCEVITK